MESDDQPGHPGQPGGHRKLGEPRRRRRVHVDDVGADRTEHPGRGGHRAIGAEVHGGTPARAASVAVWAPSSAQAEEGLVLTAVETGQQQAQVLHDPVRLGIEEHRHVARPTSVEGAGA